MFSRWRPHIFIGDPIFSLETPYFHWRPHFFLETPYFHWRPPDSRLRPQYFHYGHHILFENPQILVGDPHIFIGDTQEFHWRPQDFHWKPHIFVGQPHVKGVPNENPNKNLGVSNENIEVLNQNLGVSNLNLGVSKENMGSPIVLQWCWFLPSRLNQRFSEITILSKKVKEDLLFIYIEIIYKWILLIMKRKQQEIKYSQLRINILCWYI